MFTVDVKQQYNNNNSLNVDPTEGNEAEIKMTELFSFKNTLPTLRLYTVHKGSDGYTVFRSAIIWHLQLG